MNMTITPGLITHTPLINQSKNQSQTILKSNVFQQIFSQFSSEEEKSDLISQIKALAGQDLKTLFQALENGQTGHLPDELATQLIAQLSELSTLLAGDSKTHQDDQFIHELNKLLTNHSQDYSFVNSSDETFHILGAFILNEIDQKQRQSESTSNVMMKPKIIEQGEQLISRIIKALQLHESSPTDLKGDLNSIKLEANSLGIPKDWMQKWNELLTSFRENSAGIQQRDFSQTLHFVAPKIVKSINQLINNQFGQTEKKNTNILFLKGFNTSESHHGQKALQQEITQLNQQPLNSHMTRQEQFVIHMTRPNQTVSQGSNQQHMIEQLEKIIQSTRFTQYGGQKQLSIQLKPAHLGDMMLKFTQIDGQMTVKITVMTQAAKEMLEGNLQQLRHLFSPNQVVIERQVEPSNTDYSQQFTDDEQTHSDEHSKEHEQDQQESRNDQSEKSFKDYLFEEEV